MGNVCELCNNQNAEDKVEGITLCRNCAVHAKKMFLDDMDATRTLANAVNYPNASENATRKIINYARKRLNLTPIVFDPSKQRSQYSGGSKNEEEALEILGYRKKSNDSQVTNEQPSLNENRNSNIVRQENTTATSNRKAENKKSYSLKYRKVLSADDKRDWIENYINIKRFIAVIYAIIGLVVGYFIAKLFGSGVMGYIFWICVGCGIASALGTNAVGTAMMEAITAEQSMITEELLTEILNNMEKED